MRGTITLLSVVEGGPVRWEENTWRSYGLESEIFSPPQLKWLTSHCPLFLNGELKLTLEKKVALKRGEFWEDRRTAISFFGKKGHDSYSLMRFLIGDTYVDAGKYPDPKYMNIPDWFSLKSPDAHPKAVLHHYTNSRRNEDFPSIYSDGKIHALQSVIASPTVRARMIDMARQYGYGTFHITLEHHSGPEMGEGPAGGTSLNWLEYRIINPEGDTISHPMNVLYITAQLSKGESLFTQSIS